MFWSRLALTCPIKLSENFIWELTIFYSNYRNLAIYNRRSLVAQVSFTRQDRLWELPFVKTLLLVSYSMSFKKNSGSLFIFGQKAGSISVTNVAFPRCYFSNI